MRKFRVGDKFETVGIFDGRPAFHEVIRRTETEIVTLERWTSEDTWEECSDESTFKVEIDEAANAERIEIWEYLGEHGYIWAENEEEIKEERKMTRKQLEELTREQLIALVIKQDKAIAEIRGYESGMGAADFDILDAKTLIDCFLKNEKNFKLNTKIKEEKEMTATFNGTFTLNGTTYSTNAKGNYFYKTTGKKDAKGNDLTMRIGKAVYDKALDEFWTTEEGKAIKEAEKKAKEEAKAEKKTGKKATKRIRKSKDVMYTHKSGLTLTAKQVEFIMHIPDTSFYEKGLNSTPWCDVLADEIGGQFAGKPMTVGAMISTLREKHLIFVDTDRINGKKAKYFGFTELGKEIAQELGLN